MARFIEVDKGVWVNADHIVAIIPSPLVKTSCNVVMADGSGYTCSKASASDLAKKADSNG